MKKERKNYELNETIYYLELQMCHMKVFHWTLRRRKCSVWNMGDPNTEEWRKPHWEIVERHNWVDFERGVKVTGAGFPFYIGSLAQLQRALINYFINEGNAAGFTELRHLFC